MAGNGEKAGDRRKGKVTDPVYPNGEAEFDARGNALYPNQATEPTHLVPATVMSPSPAPSTAKRTQLK